MTAEKIDLYKRHKEDYAAPGKPKLVDIGEAKYLLITGRGAPGGEEFSAKIGALYGAAYTIKMTRKFEGRQDYVVCKLEGQYWCEGEGGDFGTVPKEAWCWNLMIRTPDFVAEEELKSAADRLREKGKGAEVENVRLVTLREGPCLQMLHVGPYENEKETLDRMTEFAEREGLVPHGLHHEIYLSDPRRIPPERLKTILRMPVKAK